MRFIHNALCRVVPAQIEQDEDETRRYSAAQDNALVRLLRASHAGLLTHKSAHHKYDNRIFSAEKDQPLLLGLTTEELAAALQQIFERGEVDYYLRSYGWNSQGPDAGKAAAGDSPASANRFLPRPAWGDYALVSPEADSFGHEPPRLIGEVGEQMQISAVSSEARVPSPFSRTYMFYQRLFGAALAASTPTLVGAGGGGAHPASRNPEYFRQRASGHSVACARRSRCVSRSV